MAKLREGAARVLVHIRDTETGKVVEKAQFDVWGRCADHAMQRTKEWVAKQWPGKTAGLFEKFNWYIIGSGPTYVEPNSVVFVESVKL